MNILRLFAGCAAVLSAALGGSLPLPALADHGMPRTETKPFRPQPSNAAEPWFLRHEAEDPPLFDNLGGISFPVTTSNPQAQRYFDQGLRLTYAFNHAEALRAYRMAQRLDPRCAMCYWGEALVVGPNINAPMDPAAVGTALAAVTKAQSFADDAEPQERALIEALAARYSANPEADRAALDAAYADAMAAVTARYPDDPEIATLYAEALMNLSPWNYWIDGSRQPKGRTAETLATLERVLARHPDHAGAIHYYIHLVEASDRPRRAEPYADRLGGQMPGAGHLVHMPSHIYYRIGRYRDSLEANRAAVAADEAYLARVPAEGIYPDAYYPHNIHFLMTSAQMAGDGRTAVAAAEKLQGVVRADAARTIPWVQPIMQAPYYTHAQFSEPAAILALPEPDDSLPFVKAAWHYARGVAFAAGGDTAAATGEAEAIARLETTADFSVLAAGGVPAPQVLQIARHVVQGRIAQAQRDLGSAKAEFEQAVALQDGLAYMEPPYWYYPVRQSLGAVLLQAGELDRAEQVFRTALERTPGNSWAMFGLVEVYKARGDHDAAAALTERLNQVSADDRGAIDLGRL